MRSSAGLCILMTCLLTANGAAATYTVRPDGSGDFPTIQAAIDGSVDGDIVQLADGTFAGPGNRDVDFRGKAITVRSQSGDPGTCEVDCEGTESERHRGFVFRSGETRASVLQGITIRNGYGFPEPTYAIGGGVFCQGSSPSLVDCILLENRGDEHGGGLACLDGSPLVSGCRFLSNYAFRSGGGALCHQSALEVVGSLFKDNFGPEAGGAAFVEDGSASFSGCTFASNSAELGGGLYLEGLTGTVDHCTFDRNVGSGGPDAAAGIQVDDVTLSVEFTIVASSPLGAGVLCFGPAGIPIRCCDVYGNAGGDWVDCLEGQLGRDGNISADPLFCDPAVDDYRLDGESPCLPGNHPDGVDCGLIGAWGLGCGAVAVEPTSWGSIKASYR